MSIYSPSKGLEIEVSNIKSSAPIRVGVYKNTGGFPDEDKVDFAKESLPSKGGKHSVFFADLPKGEYAVAVYQDLNNNGKLDTNLVGYPSEPFAFSNNIKPRFSAPKFEKCAFQYDGKSMKIVIKLID